MIEKRGAYDRVPRSTVSGGEILGLVLGVPLALAALAVTAYVVLRIVLKVVTWGLT